MLLIFILKLVFFILCGVLGLTLLVLIFPVVFSFSGEFTEEYKRFLSKVSLISGLLGLRIQLETGILNVRFVFLGITLFIFRKPMTGQEKKKKKGKPAKKEKKKLGKKNAGKLSTIDWLVIVSKIFPRVLKPVKFKQLECDLKVGFASPAATGYFISSYYMFRYTIKTMRNLQIEADFNRAGIFGNVELRGLIHLIQYVSILIFAYKQYRQRVRQKRR